MKVTTLIKLLAIKHHTICFFVRWVAFLFCFGGSFSLAETVRIANYNVRNYLLENRMVEGVYRTDYPKPEKEKAAVWAIIKASQADVIALQEIGEELFLEELQTDLNVYGLDYPYRALMTGIDKERHTAVLSKKPFLKVNRYDALDFKYFEGRERVKRGLLEVVLGDASNPWSLFVVHLKSRWTDRKDDPESSRRRIGEAEAIRRHLLKNHLAEGVDSAFLLVGDFNDHKNSSALRRFISKGGERFLHFVPAYDSRDETWTYHYKKEDRYERVDFIFASPALWPAVVDGVGTIVDLEPETSIASDHRLIYIDLELNQE